MSLPVMHPAERYREFVTHLAAQRPILCEPQMVGVARAAFANETGLRGDIFEVRLVSIASREFAGLFRCRTE